MNKALLRIIWSIIILFIIVCVLGFVVFLFLGSIIPGYCGLTGCILGIIVFTVISVLVWNKVNKILDDKYIELSPLKRAWLSPCALFITLIIFKVLLYITNPLFNIWSFLIAICYYVNWGLFVIHSIIAAMNSAEER